MMTIQTVMLSNDEQAYNNIVIAYYANMSQGL